MTVPCGHWTLDTTTAVGENRCLVSYCDTHLQPHYQSPAFKKHKLVTKLQNICSRHAEVRKLFCRTDQQCICAPLEEHKGHQVISAAAERTERQKELDLSLHNVQQRIQEREKDMTVQSSINNSADRAVEDCDAIFNELISSMERRRSEVRGLIRDQQKCEVSRAEELNLREVTELRRRHAELEHFSRTEDHVHFLQRYTSSMSRISESTHPAGSDIRPLRCFEDVTVAVSKMRDKLEDILKEEWTEISGTVNKVDVLPSTSEPKTKDELLQYACPITLDPNTAHQLLSLSEGNRKVTLMDKPQSHPPHPERFIRWYQVLSREGLTGRRYWEVECSGKKVHIAVSYKDISRTGALNESAFAFNDSSWSLQCNRQSCVFIHRGIKTKIPFPSGSVLSRVGVYLDHGAGTLSFYSVPDMSLLHTVQTAFTQTLYAGFWLPSYRGATAELCDLK